MSLHAAVVRTVVTPPLGEVHGTWRLRTGRATGTHDELLATVLLLQQDGESAVVVSVDLLAVDRAFTTAVQRRVETVCGLPAASVLVNATHNHTAPAWPLETAGPGSVLERWRDGVVDRVVGAVWAAQQRLVPARAGWRSFTVDGLTTNRVWPETPAPSGGSVMAVDTADGHPMATVVAFACHAVAVGGHTLDWGTDFPGALRRHVDDALPGSVTMFLQGAAGDLAPFDFWFGNEDAVPMGQHTADRLGGALARRVVAARDRVRTSRRAEVRVTHGDVVLARRRVPWSTAELDALERELPPDPAGPAVWPAHVHTTTSATQEPRYYQRLALAHYRGLVEAPPDLEVELVAVRVGERALVGAPFELFSQYATDVAAAVDDAGGPSGTVTLGYCTDYLGYLPPDGALAALGGHPLDALLDQDRFRWAYGITNTSVADGQGRSLVTAAADLVLRTART